MKVGAEVATRIHKRHRSIQESDVTKARQGVSCLLDTPSGTVGKTSVPFGTTSWNTLQSPALDKVVVPPSVSCNHYL